MMSLPVMDSTTPQTAQPSPPTAPPPDSTMPSPWTAPHQPGSTYSTYISVHNFLNIQLIFNLEKVLESSD